MSDSVEKEGITFVFHTFGPGETIQAIIRKHNFQTMTEHMLTKLSERYNRLNGSQVPHPGERVKIPLFVGFLGMPQHKRSYEND